MRTDITHRVPTDDPEEPNQVRIGHVIDGVYYKDPVDPARHMMREPPGWGNSEDSLAQAEAAGATEVLITETPKGDTWRIALARIRAIGIPRRNPDDLDDLQYIVPLRYWEHRDAYGTLLAAAKLTREEQAAANKGDDDAPQQLDFLGPLRGQS